MKKQIDPIRVIHIHPMIPPQNTNALRGYRVEIGCKTLIYDDAEKLTQDLLAYCLDPSGVERNANDGMFGSPMAGSEPCPMPETATGVALGIRDLALVDTLERGPRVKLPKSAGKTITFKRRTSAVVATGKSRGRKKKA